MSKRSLTILPYLCLPYSLMGISNVVHQKRIQLAIKKIHRPCPEKVGDSQGIWAKRLNIRRTYQEGNAATVIQKNCRMFLAMKLLADLRNKLKVDQSREAVQQLQKLKGVWWTDLQLPFDEPKIKRYGRRLDYKGVQGWGHWEGKKWVAKLNQEEKEAMAKVEADDHDSKYWVIRLEKELELMKDDRKTVCFNKTLASEGK